MEDNNLESQLAKVVEKALQVAEQTGEFVIDQAPELLREFYLWHIVDNSIGIVFNLLMLTIIILIVRYFGRKDDWDFDDGNLVTSFWVGLIIGGINLIWLFYNIAEIAQIIIAPKIYLIEYFLTK